MAQLVPVVDLGPWFSGDDAARRAVAGEVDRACRSIGFLQVVGHGIPDAVIAEMIAATSEFFDRPLAEKLRLAPPSPDVNRGYAQRGSENLTYSLGDHGALRPPDLFEAFNVGPDTVDESDPAVMAERARLFAPNLWPGNVPTFRPAMVAYFAAARRVADTLLDVFAIALGLESGWFGEFTTHSTDTLRIIRYRTAPDDPAPLDRQLGMGAHTDYGICTVLHADQAQGLQVLDPDGVWHDVIPEAGALLVNLGDLTAQWTNDRWRSTLHRVQPPARLPDAVNERRSVAFFHDGNWDALVECLPTCADANNPPRYPPVRAGDHLMAKLIGPRTMTASTATNTAADRLDGVRA